MTEFEKMLSEYKGTDIKEVLSSFAAKLEDTLKKEGYEITQVLVNGDIKNSPTGVLNLDVLVITPKKEVNNKEAVLTTPKLKRYIQNLLHYFTGEMLTDGEVSKKIGYVDFNYIVGIDVGKEEEENA